MTNFNQTINSLLSFRASEIHEIPAKIIPVTRPYTLEVLYWGLRNLKETNFITVGTQTLSLDIEIGALRPLEPNFLDKCSPNENFSLTHRKCKIDLPEIDEYKPHLNIKCECYSSLFLYNSPQVDLDLVKKILERKILIGSYTVNSISKYIYGNDKLSQFLKKNSKFQLKNKFFKFKIY